MKSLFVTNTLTYADASILHQLGFDLAYDLRLSPKTQRIRPIEEEVFKALRRSWVNYHQDIDLSQALRSRCSILSPTWANLDHAMESAKFNTLLIVDDTAGALRTLHDRYSDTMAPSLWTLTDHRFNAAA